MQGVRISVSCAVALMLAACGGSGSDGSGNEPPPQPDPLAAYKNQEVNWGSCAQYFSGNGSLAIHLAKLGDRVRCADIKAPLDYQNPDGLQISLSMLRVKAAESSETKPNLFFNPGGPGGDGQVNSLYFSMLLSNGSGDSVLGRKYKEVSDAYNFVGFSPRGVGASTNILCAGNELTYPTDYTRWGDSVENIRRLTDSARYIASNCQKNPVSDYIHTDATARDMDLMRHLLGDAKLHYHGTSYGTWLGFWYAGIFPDRVGPMVLDSNMNFSRPIHDAGPAYQNGRIHTFNKYMAPYMARNNDVFKMGNSVESIINDLSAINPHVNQALLHIGGSFRVEDDEIPGYISSVKAAIEVQKLLDAGETLDDIETKLKQGGYIADPGMDKVFQQRALSLVEALRALDDPGFYSEASTFSLDNEGSVWNTVICNDEDLRNKDQAYWVDVGFELARRLQIIRNITAIQPCLHWNRKTSVRKPSMESLKDAPLLMVQSEFDVPTPLAGAMETFELLPATRMVRVRNDGTHGISVYETECVDITVMNYLLGKAPAQRLTDCQGKPLPFDPVPLTDNVASSAHAGAPSKSHFEDPELARDLINRLREAVAP